MSVGTVVVTVTTQPVIATAATPTNIDSSSSSGSSSLSSNAIAGIIIGSLLGGVLFVGLVFYLLNRRRRREFRRVANPTHVPSTGSRKRKAFPRHIQRPSVSTEPLMSPVQWPHHASTSHIHSSNAGPLRSESLSPGIRDSQYSFYEADTAEIGQVVAAGTVTHSATPALLNIPPARKPEPAFSKPSRSGSSSAPERTLRASDDDAGGPRDEAAGGTPPKAQQSLFLHRMLQSRAKASEAVALSPSSPLDDTRSRSGTLDSLGTLVDVDALLADADSSALRDAQANDHDGNEGDEEDDDLETVESEYSQLSAPIDHSVYFADPVSGRNSFRRQHSTRRRGRMPTLPPELSPVPEMPDTPRTSNRSSPRPVSTAANSSLDAHGSHRTGSRSSVAVDRPLQLLTSIEFGKDSSTSTGCVSSKAGLGSTSSSSGRASRYPSLAPSSVGQHSGSGSRSEGETDWHHPPSGLAALTSLQIGTLDNPHSPVEQLSPSPPSQTGVSRSPSHATNESPAPDTRAHLRAGRVSSIPEVERRTVMQCGIATIDVAL